MVHAALLPLMLEAVTTDLVFTISLKRSTPNLQLSTRTPADYPILHPQLRTLRRTLICAAQGRLCCKSRKLQGHVFFAKALTEKKSPIRIASIALPKPPVSLARGDEAPHIFT